MSSGKQWFVCISGASLGPIETQVVHLMIEQKRLSPMEFVWCEGMDSWKRVCEIEEFGGTTAPEAPSIPVPQATKTKVAPPPMAPKATAMAPKAPAPPKAAAPVAPKASTPKPILKAPAKPAAPPMAPKA